MRTQQANLFMPYPLPMLPRYFRLLAFIFGAAIFLWLSIEDNHAAPAALLGGGMSALVGTHWLFDKFGGKAVALNTLITGGILLGALIGAGSTLTTALLMLLKNGSHGHVFPDYPLGMIIEILWRFPAWALAGGLIGLGVALLWLAVLTMRSEAV